MSASPIYLLRDSATDVPYDYAKIASMIYYEELDEDTLSKTEGMSDWRSIPETRIWSEAKILKEVCGEAQIVIARLADNKIEVRQARTEVKKALTQKGISVDLDTLDNLGTVLSVNCQLMNHCLNFKTNRVSSFFPTQELASFSAQNFKRDWLSVWQQAGGKIYNGRMIARRDDPIWFAISDFGYPFPPFSFDVAMWVKDIDIPEAEKLGVPDLNKPIVFPEIQPWRFVGI